MAINFEKEQQKVLEQQAKEILELAEAGESTRNIMAQIYARRMEGGSLQEGAAAADAMLEAIARFDRDYAAAQEDLDGFIRGFQEKIDEGRSCAQRCTCWLQIAAYLSAAAAGAKEDQEKLRSLSVSDEEATPRLEEQLREKAAQAIQNAGTVLAGQPIQEKLLERTDDAGEMVLDLGGKELEYRGILSMLAYTAAAGEPFTAKAVSPEQTAAAVCAQVEEARVADSLSKGERNAELAAKLLTVLAIIAIVALLIWNFEFIFVDLIGSPLANFLFDIGIWEGLALPAVIAAAGGAAYLVYRFGKILYQLNRQMMRCVFVHSDSVREGEKQAVSYVQATARPQAREEAEETLEQLEELGKTGGAAAADTGVVLES